MVATRTDVDCRGAGYGDPPLAPKGGHQERRSKGPEDSHKHQGGTCRVLRTLLGRWQAHRGERPSPLVEVRPQERVQRHRVGIITDVLPFVQILDDPVPLTGNAVVEVLQKIDTPTLEQVVAVPKISQDRIQPRLVDLSQRPTQMVEQLVEVPTVLSVAVLRQSTAEQIIDIPVPRGHGDRGGLQGSLPRQTSAALFPWNRTVDIPAGGGLQDFLPDPGASSSSAVSRDERRYGVFRTFPQVKKSAKSAGSPSAELLREVSSWTPAAYGRHHSWVLVMPADAQFYYWNRHTGTTFWSMPDGWLPCWLMHADLQSQVVYKSIDEF